MFRSVPLPIIRSLFTVHPAMVGAGPGWSSILILLESCLQNCMTYTIAECTVNKLLMMDRRNCPKHVEFTCQNKFVKLVRLVGFIKKKSVTHSLLVCKKKRATSSCYNSNGFVRYSVKSYKASYLTPTNDFVYTMTCRGNCALKQILQ